MKYNNFVTQIPRQKISLWGNVGFCLLFCFECLLGVWMPYIARFLAMLFVPSYVLFLVALDRFSSTQTRWLNKHGVSIPTEFTKVMYVLHEGGGGDKWAIATTHTDQNGKKHSFRSNIVVSTDFRDLTPYPVIKKQISMAAKRYMERHGSINVIVNPYNYQIYHFAIDLHIPKPGTAQVIHNWLHLMKWVAIAAVLFIFVAFGIFRQ